MLKKSTVLTLLAGMSLWVLARLLFAAEKQEALYIVPVYVFIIGRWASAAFPLLFFVWNPGLFQGHAPVPKRSHALLVVTTLLTAVWFIYWWRKEVAAEGPKYIYLVCAVNVLWIGSLWTLFAQSRKGEPSFKMNLLFHWMLFAWLYLFAFPTFIGPLFRS
jgi:hypothetical protein